MNEYLNSFSPQLGRFLPNLLGAIAILILGWLFATIIASIVKGILKGIGLERRVERWTGVEGTSRTPFPLESWLSTAVYWIILLFTLIAFLNALNLTGVSQPLNNFLDQIFLFLPRLGGAIALTVLAWLIATVSKLLLTRGLARFNLDDRLAAQTGTAPNQAPFLLNETLANALYWFIFLFFLPFILDTLGLQAALAPVQNLLNQILSALPKIFVALIIGAVGWLIARVVRGIVTNLLASVGTDQLGVKVGLTRTTGGGLSLSSILGTLVYVLVLIPTTIAALNALEIRAISEPAIAMLEQILEAIPRIFTAGLVLVLFYVIGRFVAEFVSNILAGLGFNNIFNWLGIPAVQTALERPTVVSSDPLPSDLPPPGTTTPQYLGATVLQPQRRTPSEIMGVIALIAILLFGAVAATEILRFPALTETVRAILRIFARVLSGIVVFGIGLYLANLTYHLIDNSGSRQSRILAQVARIAILALVGAMALQQMGVATDIVNLAFGLLLGALAVAIALSFGLGGRDIAADQIRDWLTSFKRS
jgi:hypothetical protein